MNTINPMSSQYTQMLQQISHLTQNQGSFQTDEIEKSNFLDIFNSAINTIEQKQTDSNMAVQSLIDGTSNDLHNVMIKTTEAQLSLEVAVQLRNRALEAYNEIKNMQF